jgi:hypothetical protein
MKTYVYRGALYCTECAVQVAMKLGRALQPAASTCDDSDVFPCGPYAHGGGEADSPSHCDRCGVFLKNPLTPDGMAYVSRWCNPYNWDNPPADELARRLRAASYHAKAEWVDFYGVES